MSQQKTTFMFRSKSYEVILDQGQITFAEKAPSSVPTRLDAGISKRIKSLEKAKLKVQNFLLRRPDPGMTFSD
jgi:hypothetical protein